MMRVLLADGRRRVRSAVRLLLEQQPDIEVLGEAVDALGLLDWLSAAAPDLVLLDWDLPGGERGAVIAAVRQRCSAIRVLALSGLPEARQEAREAGADGFVSKGDPPECLLEAIRSSGRNRHPGHTRNPRAYITPGRVTGDGRPDVLDRAHNSGKGEGTTSVAVP